MHIIIHILIKNRSRDMIKSLKNRFQMGKCESEVSGNRCKIFFVRPSVPPSVRPWASGRVRWVAVGVKYESDVVHKSKANSYCICLLLFECDYEYEYEYMLLICHTSI